MSMTEIKNITAKCLDMKSDSKIVLHEVSYDVKDSGVWTHKVQRVMATDPIDAINYIKQQGE